jgi:hypothetical protein
MAVVETIRIEGDGSGFEQTVNQINEEVKDLNKNVKNVGATADKSFEKAEKAVKDVEKEVKNTGDGIKDLIKNITALGVITKLTDAASEAFTQNQKVVDVLNTGLFAAQLLVSNLIDYFTGGKKSLREAFTGVLDQARELVELQKAAQLAEVQRIKLQFQYQTLAEEQRQIRDDERKSLAEREAANERLNEILKAQLADEMDAVDAKIAAAQAEVGRINNIENQVALEQAITEQLDIQERLRGQESEFLMNNLALARERLEISQIQNESETSRLEFEKEMNILFQRTQVGKLQAEQMFQDSIFQNELARVEKTMALYEVDSVAYQQALNEKEQIQRDWQLFSENSERSIQQVRIEAVQQGFDLTAQSFSALGDLYSALNSDNEQNAEQAFRVNKALQLASAVASTAAAVTAQLAVPQDALTGANFVKAGIALTTGLAQIATIQNTQFQPSGGGGSSYGGQTSIQAPPQPAQFNLVSRSGNNILVESLAAQFEKPMKAYVVSGEVISGTELDRRRIRTATFG